MKKKANTIQIGLRIEKSLLERIEKMAEFEQIDKMSWIRRALVTFLKGEEQEEVHTCLEDYINLRIEEKTLLEKTGFKKVPNDIAKARADIVNNILTERKRE
ncbi:MAG: hypothetical protein V1859_09070 [archaeon]